MIKQKGPWGIPETEHSRGEQLPPLYPGMGPGGVKNIQHGKKQGHEEIRDEKVLEKHSGAKVLSY